MSKKQKELKRITKELRKFHTDLGEVTVMADLDWQVERLGQIVEDLENASTLIHGGGTGHE